MDRLWGIPWAHLPLPAVSLERLLRRLYEELSDSGKRGGATVRSELLVLLGRWLQQTHRNWLLVTLLLLMQMLLLLLVKGRCC